VSGTISMLFYYADLLKMGFTAANKLKEKNVLVYCFFFGCFILTRVVY